MNAVTHVNHPRYFSDAAWSRQGHVFPPSVATLLLRQVSLPEPSNDILPAPSCRIEGARIFIAGHGGLVGSALRRRLLRERCEILTVDRRRLDLRRQLETENWMAVNRPDVVLLAAATVGGSASDRVRPAEFLSDNLAIAQNVIEASRKFGVKKLVFFASSCIYPRLSRQPITEDALLSGSLEPTNEAYALAKICGLKLAQAIRRQHGCDFISVIPANLYGPGDRFDAERAHIIPALIERFYNAKMAKDSECIVWEAGQARREFLHVDDCADGIVHALQSYSGDEPLNLGSGEEVSIATLAKLIADVVGYSGRVVFNPDASENAPEHLLDSSRVRALGWRPHINLRDGLIETVCWWRKLALRTSAVSRDSRGRTSVSLLPKPYANNWE